MIEVEALEIHIKEMHLEEAMVAEASADSSKSKDFVRLVKPVGIGILPTTELTEEEVEIEAAIQEVALPQEAVADLDIEVAVEVDNLDFPTSKRSQVLLLGNHSL